MKPETLLDQTLTYDSLLDSSSTPAQTYKVIIPGRLPGEARLLVNSKQAHRILIQRQKRFKRMIHMLDQGLPVNPKLIGSRETISRKKDRAR